MKSLVAVLAVLTLPSLAWAQAPAAPATKASAAPPVEPLRLSAAARELLDTRPKTPREKMVVVKLLVDMEEPAAARKLVTELLAANLDATQLAAMHSEYGTAFFVKLGFLPELRPESKMLADAVLAAATARARDPAFIESLVGQLKGTSLAARSGAVQQLRLGDEAALAALVEILANPARVTDHAAVRFGLAALEDEALPALAQLIAADDAGLVAQAAQVLGQMSDPEARLYLLAPALAAERPAAVRDAASAALRAGAGGLPTRAAAAADLFVRAREYLHGVARVAARVEGQAASWQWDPATKKLAFAPLAEPIVALDRAARLAREARELAPSLVEFRRLFLTALVAAELARHPAGTPLAEGEGSVQARLKAEGLEAVMDLVRDTATHGRPAVAAACLPLVAQLGSAALLSDTGATASPLVTLARHPDRDLRLAAVESILKLDDGRHYAGLSYVTEVVGATLDSADAQQAVAWAGRLAADRLDRYDARRLSAGLERALWQPQASAAAAAVLGELGTPSGQRALADFASNTTQPLAARQAAGAALVKSVARFGTRLTTQEIVLQYERYNRTEQQSKDEQQLWGSILDAIEAGKRSAEAIPPSRPDTQTP